MKTMYALWAVVCILAVARAQLPYTPMSGGMVSRHGSGNFGMSSAGRGSDFSYMGSPTSSGMSSTSTFGRSVYPQNSGYPSNTGMGRSMGGMSSFGGSGHSRSSSVGVNLLSPDTRTGRFRSSSFGTSSVRSGHSSTVGRRTSGQINLGTQDGEEGYVGAFGGRNGFPYMGGAGASQDYADGGVRLGVGNGIGTGSIQSFYERRRTGVEDPRPDEGMSGGPMGGAGGGFGGQYAFGGGRPHMAHSSVGQPFGGGMGVGMGGGHFGMMGGGGGMPFHRW